VNCRRERVAQNKWLVDHSEVGGAMGELGGNVSAKSQGWMGTAVGMTTVLFWTVHNIIVLDMNGVQQ